MSGPALRKSSCTIAAAALLCCCPVLPALHTAFAAVLENPHLKAVIDTDTSSLSFGSVVSFADKDGADYSVENRWFRMHAGGAGASARTVLAHAADTVIVGLSQFGTLPLTARLCYTLEENALALDIKAWVQTPVEFGGGLSLDIESAFSHVACESRGLPSKAYTVAGMQPAACHLSNVLTFSDGNGSLAFVVRNPFHSLWTFNRDGTGKHALDILPVVPPYPADSAAVSGPDIVSRIEPPDTLCRRIEVYTSGGVAMPVFLSEHPGGHARCIAMYWDELPNRDGWTYMTTAVATDVKYDRFWVRLMNAHDKVKMGYLLLCDRILYREKSSFEGWEVNSPYIIGDTLDELEGAWCLNMIAEKPDTLSVRQDIACAPGASFTLAYNVKAQHTGGVVRAVVSGTGGGVLAADSTPGPILSWQERTLAFSAGAGDTSASISLSLCGAVGTAFFDDVRVVRAGTSANLVANGGFEQNQTRIIYDNKRRHWSDAHGGGFGGEYLPVKGLQNDYNSFLRRVENDSMVYGWENRVRLGCHGYHHTPSLWEPEPAWEFEYYDPEGDRLRISRIFEDMARIGLTRKSLRFWRSPGFRYTASLVNQLVDSGFVFMDPGAATDYCAFVERGRRRMFLPGLCWWADVRGGEATDGLMDMLERGHLGHFGGHPEEIFFDATEQNYDRFEAVLGDAEERFAGLSYVFPDEWADNANAVYDLRVDGVERNGADLVLRFRGRIRAGSTVAFAGSTGGAALDGAAVPTQTWGAAAYIVLPDAADGLHALVIKDAQPGEATYRGRAAPFSAGMRVDPRRRIVHFHLDAPSTVRLEVYGADGRLRYVSPPRAFGTAGAMSLRIPDSAALASGLCLFRLTTERTCSIRRCVMVR